MLLVVLDRPSADVELFSYFGVREPLGDQHRHVPRTIGAVEGRSGNAEPSDFRDPRRTGRARPVLRTAWRRGNGRCHAPRGRLLRPVGPPLAQQRPAVCLEEQRPFQHRIIGSVASEGRLEATERLVDAAPHRGEPRSRAQHPCLHGKSTCRGALHQLGDLILGTIKLAVVDQRGDQGGQKASRASIGTFSGSVCNAPITRAGSWRASPIEALDQSEELEVPRERSDATLACRRIVPTGRPSSPSEMSTMICMPPTMTGVGPRRSRATP